MAPHTTPDVPVHMHPVIGLVTLGSKCTFSASPITNTDTQRNVVVAAYPRTPRFKASISQALYDGTKHKLEITFGYVKADVSSD
jgi:hypothetical protein